MLPTLVLAVCVAAVAVADGVASPPPSDSPLDVSMLQLIVQPEKFDGKRIRVIGYCWLRFEDTALYAYEQDHLLQLSKNAIWLELEPAADTKGTLHGNYALFEGVFSASKHGHMGRFSGTLTAISRKAPWAVPPPGKQP